MDKTRFNELMNELNAVTLGALEEIDKSKEASLDSITELYNVAFENVKRIFTNLRENIEAFDDSRSKAFAKYGISLGNNMIPVDFPLTYNNSIIHISGACDDLYENSTNYLSISVEHFHKKGSFKNAINLYLGKSRDCIQIIDTDDLQTFQSRLREVTKDSVINLHMYYLNNIPSHPYELTARNYYIQLLKILAAPEFEIAIQHTLIESANVLVKRIEETKLKLDNI